jgi:PPOX class probable F420-dependent enzyme
VLDLTTAKDAHIDRRLRTETIIWLSTVRPDGRPHLVPVWFHWDGQDVLIFSKPRDQKIRNLRHSPRVVLALETADLGDEVVLIEGTAVFLDEPSSVVTPPEYQEKYAALIARLGWEPAGMAREYSLALRVTPTKFISWGVPEA